MLNNPLVGVVVCVVITYLLARLVLFITKRIFKPKALPMQSIRSNVNTSRFLQDNEIPDSAEFNVLYVACYVEGKGLAILVASKGVKNA